MKLMTKKYNMVSYNSNDYDEKIKSLEYIASIKKAIDTNDFDLLYKLREQRIDYLNSKINSSSSKINKTDISVFVERMLMKNDLCRYN